MTKADHGNRAAGERLSKGRCAVTGDPAWSRAGQTCPKDVPRTLSTSPNQEQPRWWVY